MAKNLLPTVKQLLGSVRDAARIVVGAPSSPERLQLVRRYGVIIPEAARLSACIREAGGDLFAGSTRSADQIRARQRRIGELSDIKTEVDSFGRQLGQNLQAEREALAADIHETVQVVQSLYANPLPGPALQKMKEQIEPYGAALLELIAGHKATIAARRMSTRALKGKLSESDKDLSSLKLKARFLAGETLRPEDLGGTPPPPAARRRTRR